MAEVARLRGTRVVVARIAVLAPLALMLLFPHFTYRWYADYAAQSLDYDRHFFSVDHRGRSFYYGRHDMGVAAEEMFADIERLAEPGDRLIVGPGELAVTPYSESYLYFMLPQLVPGTTTSRWIPGWPMPTSSGSSGVYEIHRCGDAEAQQVYKLQVRLAVNVTASRRRRFSTINSRLGQPRPSP